MADSEESVELLFFDTFSHDINEVSVNRINSKTMIYLRIEKSPMCDKKWKTIRSIIRKHHCNIT